MSNETSTPNNPDNNPFSEENVRFRRRDASANFNTSDSDLDISVEDITTTAMVHLPTGYTNKEHNENLQEIPTRPTDSIRTEPSNVVPGPGRAQSNTGRTEGHQFIDSRQHLANLISTNPTGTIGKTTHPIRRPHLIIQAELGPPLPQQNPQAVQTNQRTSSPIDPIDNLENLFQAQFRMDDTIDQAAALDLNATGPILGARVPEYLPPSEQIKKILNIELADSERQAKQSAQLLKMLSILSLDNPSPAIRQLNEELTKDAEEARLLAETKKTRQEAANRIVDYYKSTIIKPTYPKPPADYRKTYQRTSPKEITCLTGTFDPSNPQADFSHLWSKLIGYGQANFFTESEYKDALRYVLQGDAYETFLSFDQAKHDLNYILDYFGQVYTPKRSLNAHRQAVDNFIRNKNESLEVAMHRCLVAVDRLRVQYPPDSWPESRIWLRRNILSQIITEDTRRFIRSKEDDVLENFGISLDIDQVIKLAHKYEIEHNKAPKTEVSTLFQAASGGLAEDSLKLKSENNYLKKEVATEKSLQKTLLEYLANPVMAKRFSPEKDRDNRQRSREDQRHTSRQSQFDKNRQTSQESRPTTPNRFERSSSQPMDSSPSGSQGPPVQRFPRIPVTQPPISTNNQPYRPQTPTNDYRNRQDFQRGRSLSNDGRNSRFPSQDRYRDYRRNQSDQYRNNQQQQPYNRQGQSTERPPYNGPNRSRNVSFERLPPPQKPPIYPSRNDQRGRSPQDSRYPQRPYDYRDQRSVSRERQPYTSQQPRYRSDSQSRDQPPRDRQWNRPPYSRDQSRDRYQRDRGRSPYRGYPPPNGSYQRYQSQEKKPPYDSRPESGSKSQAIGLPRDLTFNFNINKGDVVSKELEN